MSAISRCDRCRVEHEASDFTVPAHRRVIGMVFGQSRGDTISPVVHAEADLCGLCIDAVKRVVTERLPVQG